MSFKFCDFILIFFIVLLFSFFVIFLFIFSQINFFEEVEEGLNFLLNSFLFIFIFLLDSFDSDVLSFFPVDIITKTSFDFISFKFELFGKSSVGEPFVFRESENNFKAVFRFFNSLNFGQMLNDWLINLSDFFTNNIVGNKGFEPIFRELFILVVIMLDFGFIFSKDGVSFEISIRIGVSSWDDAVDFFEEWGVFFSELNFEFSDLRSKILIDLSLLDDVVVKSDGLDLLFQGWEFFDFLFDFFFNSKLNWMKIYFFFDIFNFRCLTVSTVLSAHFQQFQIINIKILISSFLSIILYDIKSFL